MRTDAPMPQGQTPLERITLAVLAGGEGSRMGRPKAELEIDGEPVLAFLLARFNWPGPTLLVTAPGRERPPGAELFDAEAADPVAGQGPLRGLLTALEHASTDVVVAAAVDMPLVGAEYLAWLVAQLGREAGAPGVMAGRETDGGGTQIEPLPCAVRAAAKGAVAGALAAGMRSLHGLTRRPGFAVAAAPAHWPVETWTNVNRPAEWAAFLRRSAAAAGGTGD